MGRALTDDEVVDRILGVAPAPAPAADESDEAIVRRILRGGAPAPTPAPTPEYQRVVKASASTVGDWIGAVVGASVVDAIAEVAKPPPKPLDEQIVDELEDSDAEHRDEEIRALHARLEALEARLARQPVQPVARAGEADFEVDADDEPTWQEIADSESEAPIIVGEVDKLLTDGRLEEAATRIMAARPILRAAAAATKARDWQLDFGPVSAPAGETLTLFNNPQCLFRGEKVVANDTATPPGTGTRITSVVIGQKVQRPMGGSSLTAMFSARSLADGITWDTSQKYSSIAVTVSFVSACTFDLTVFGKSVL